MMSDTANTKPAKMMALFALLLLATAVTGVAGKSCAGLVLSEAVVPLFEGCTRIAGDLRIDATSDIVSLNHAALSSIVAIDGNLVITSPPVLTRVFSEASGLANLTNTSGRLEANSASRPGGIRLPRLERIGTYPYLNDVGQFFYANNDVYDPVSFP